jgi:ubiquinone/menaquinone biosynthesis C-methylase UbiE
VPEFRHTDVRHSPEVVAAYRARTAQDSAAYLLPHLKPGDSVIDLGCGEGWITRSLAAVVAPGRVVGVDNRADVIERARSLGPLPDNLAFEVADVFALPYPAAAFDVAFFHQVLQGLTDPAGALRAAARVVKPGGLVAAREADYGCAGWYPDTAAWQEWQRLYLALAEVKGVDLRVARRLIELAQAAGLTEITHQASVSTFPGQAGVLLYTTAWAERLVDPRLVREIERAGLGTKAGLHQLAGKLKAWAEHPAAFLGLPQGELTARVPLSA